MQHTFLGFINKLQPPPPPQKGAFRYQFPIQITTDIESVSQSVHVSLWIPRFVSSWLVCCFTASTTKMATSDHLCRGRLLVIIIANATLYSYLIHFVPRFDTFQSVTKPGTPTLSSLSFVWWLASLASWLADLPVPPHCRAEY